jgi:molybdopterin molybdotransferase
MLSLDEARTHILDDLSALGPESVPLADALHRVAALEIRATKPSPGFDNSAMDGYALRAGDTTGAVVGAPVHLKLTGTIPAGKLPRGAVGPGEAHRIFTGAPLPEGADAVVTQEEVETHGTELLLVKPVPPGQDVRRIGNDLRVGELLIPAGRVIMAGEINVLAAQGHAQVEVQRRPRVAILPTGDELREIDEPLGLGQVPNSSSHGLAAQVRAAGGVPVRMPIAPDEPTALGRLLAEAARSADLVLTTGGVSVGDFDLVRDALQKAGHVDFWRVAIKPGKPLAYGRVCGTPLLGLPGNPISTFVCFELFGRPAVFKLGGQRRLLPRTRRVRLAADVRRDPARREFSRARLEERAGETWAVPHARQGSAQLSSLLGVDALIDLAAGDDVVRAGALVDVLLLDTTPCVGD